MEKIKLWGRQFRIDLILSTQQTKQIDWYFREKRWENHNFDIQHVSDMWIP